MSIVIVSNGPSVGAPIVPDTRPLSALLPSPIVATHPLFFGENAKVEDAGKCCRYMHRAHVAATDLVLVYLNPNGNAITVTASIEYPSGTFYPVHFSGENSSRGKEIAAGVFAHTQPLGISIPAGATFYTNTLIVPAAGGGYLPGNRYAFIGNNAGGDTSGQRCHPGTTDYTLSANPGSAETFYGYGPTAVCGSGATAATRAHTRQIGLIGDSIAAGTGDNLKIAGVANFENGWLARACFENNIAYLNTGIGGHTGAGFATTLEQLYLMQHSLMANCSTVIWEYITNDLMQIAETLATIQAAYIKGWAQLAARGPQVWAATCTPRTTSTDAWATAANQTAISGVAGHFGPEPSVRQGYNAWLRDGAPINVLTLNAEAVGASGASVARCKVYSTTGLLVTAASGPVGHPLTGTIDAGGAVEEYSAGKTTWVWKPSAGTTDGIHPGEAGHLAMKAAVPVEALA